MDDVGVCYVCFSPGGGVRCKCRLLIHDHCLVRLLDNVPSARGGRCAICKSCYDGVALRPSPGLEFDPAYAWSVCILTASASLMTGCMTLFTAMCDRDLAGGPLALSTALVTGPVLFVACVNCLVILATCKHQSRQHGVLAAFSFTRRASSRFVVEDGGRLRTRKSEASSSHL